MISRTGFLAVLAAVAVLSAACAQNDPMGPMEPMEPTPTPTPQMAPGMDSMNAIDGMPPSGDFAPSVKGFARGDTIVFIHTEASDPQVANMLTMMMGPEVVLVPALAQAPEELLADVYVFTNGVPGMGPFGYQPDVFDTLPGDEGYRPLRSVLLVTWNEGITARELHSEEEIQEAEARGELTIERPGVVVNMPILIWPGGRR